MKLWLDDVREPPDETWIWAKTVDEAKQILAEHKVNEQSLDHDLGSHEPDGHTLVVWELDHKRVPILTTIHSWNRAGALRMSQMLLQHKHHALVQPAKSPPTRGRRTATETQPSAPDVASGPPASK